MQLIVLKSKIQRATLTGLEVDYEGSISIDEDILDAANMVRGEQVHVLNYQNASRIVTYTIAAPRGSGTVMLNGPAALLGEIGQEVAILAYGQADEAEARAFKPTVVKVNSQNRLV